MNHPDIITVYDIDISDGIDFIAIEYVDGKTLGQLIGHRGLPLAEVLRYATEIADALTAAHTAAVVHRDLKPGNVIVSEKGRVKVLDFGLAKLSQQKAGGDELTQSMTREQEPQTEGGTIVGTIAYMSPEQASGKKVDWRSDIFSFGSVLYEMVTGSRPFHAVQAWVRGGGAPVGRGPLAHRLRHERSIAQVRIVSGINAGLCPVRLLATQGAGEHPSPGLVR